MIPCVCFKQRHVVQNLQCIVVRYRRLSRGGRSRRFPG